VRRVETVYPPVITLARAVFRAQGLRFTIEGAENVPRHGGAVMAINHVGYMDFTYAGLAARPAGRLVRFMAKEEVFHHPLAGPLMRGMRHIPVDRAAGASSFRRAVEALRSGEIVGVFPEATISRSFELKEFKSGAVRMASDAGVPVLPTVIWGSQRVWTKDHPKRLVHPGAPVHVYVGEPMAVTGRGADLEVATEELRRRMERLLHRAQAAYEDAPRDDADRWWLPVRLGGTAPTPERAAELDEAERRDRVRRYAAKAKAARDKERRDQERRDQEQRGKAAR
jgi:1-acyl-sn-glycerol-3-phosphate acyltransferase